MPKVRERKDDDSIRFILNDSEVALSDVAPTATLLDYLRLERRLTGTKEGCAEGDCGACTVLVGRLAGETLVYESVNACIRFVGSLHATHVVTVEHLAARDGTLHPGAAGDGRFPRLAMRLLHARLRHVALWPLAFERQSQPGRHRKGAARQPLSLHRLRADRQGGRGRRKRAAFCYLRSDHGRARGHHRPPQGASTRENDHRPPR